MTNIICGELAGYMKIDGGVCGKPPPPPPPLLPLPIILDDDTFSIDVCLVLDVVVDVVDDDGIDDFRLILAL
ncbi:hypothetical protein DERP_010096, partial [Dermatophagoides pteronyssinus]